MMQQLRNRRALTPLVIVVALLVGAAAMPARQEAAVATVAEKRLPSLGHNGRWFTDENGRVVMLRGFNFVEKWRPAITPEADGFDDDDAALIAANGFNTVRLGVAFEFLMPEPGKIDRRYVASLARTARILGQHGLFVLLDFHQDGWGPVTGGNGMPAWTTYTDGYPNIPAPFPAYYVKNPALQRAFDNFWANRAGPGGIGLQDYYAQGMVAVATRFASMHNLIGYEAMNEPWPGTNWSTCLTGCPDLEAQLLLPFHNRMRAALRTVDRRHPLFVEPFVLFNFGNTDTVVPANSKDALSTHVYGLNLAANANVMDRSVAAADRDSAPLLVTEWGASENITFLGQTVNQFDARLVPWLYWSYNGLVVTDSNQPLVAPNLHVPVLDALTRPYPTRVNGTPTHLAFDTTTKTLELSFSTRRPDGRRSLKLETEVVIPARNYPAGYAVVVTGADVTSKPCASTLTLRNQPGAQTVSVRVTPAACQ